LIAIGSVSTYVGQTVTVCDKVAGTFGTKSDIPLTNLNLGANFPNAKLTIVIFQKAWSISTLLLQTIGME